MYNIKIMLSFFCYLYYGCKYTAVSIEQPLDYFLAPTGHSNSAVPYPCRAFQTFSKYNST